MSTPNIETTVNSAHMGIYRGQGVLGTLYGGKFRHTLQGFI